MVVTFDFSGEGQIRLLSSHAVVLVILVLGFSVVGVFPPSIGRLAVVSVFCR